MKLTDNSEQYDELQLRFLREILVAIKDELEASDMDHDHVFEMTARIGYAVCSAIDGAAPAGTEGPVAPVLAFLADTARPDEAVINSQSTPLHELVYNLFENVFEDQEGSDEDDDDDEDYEDDDEEEDEYDDEFEDEDEFEDDEQADDGEDRRH